MDLNRLRELSGITLNEATTPEQQLAALQQQYKNEVDSRARSTLSAQIKKLQAQIANNNSPE